MTTTTKIVCDHTNNTPETIAKNELVCDVYIEQPKIIFNATILPDGKIVNNTESPIAIYLKTWPEYFEAVCNDSKTFEIRRNDRPFSVGVKLVLREYDPTKDNFTGRYIERVITYITDWEQKPGFVVLAIKPITFNATKST